MQYTVDSKYLIEGKLRRFFTLIFFTYFSYLLHLLLLLILLLLFNTLLHFLNLVLGPDKNVLKKLNTVCFTGDFYFAPTSDFWERLTLLFWQILNSLFFYIWLQFNILQCRISIHIRIRSAVSVLYLQIRSS